MVSRLRCLLTVRPGMPPRPPPLPRAPRQSRLRCRTSAVSPRAPRTFQKSREAAACRIRCPPRPRSGAWRIRFDPPPPPVDRAAWRIRAHAGASPAAAPPYSRIAPLRFGTWASPSTSYGCRARTGFPPAVWSHQSVGMAPDHAATGRLPHGRYDSASTKAAPEKSCYHPCRDCANGQLSAPSLPDSPHRRHAAEDDLGRFRPPAGSDGALRLRPRARRTPPRRASSSRWRGSPPCRTGRGSPPAGRSGRSRRPSAATPWPANSSTGWAELAATAAGTTTSPPAPSPPRRDAWPRCRRTSSARPSHQ